MKIEWRHIVAVVLLVFAWKGNTLNIDWPPPPHDRIETPKPSKELLAWAEPLRKILPSMLPQDRRCLANFYDAMTFVLLRDANRDTPIITTTEDFERFHGGSLEATIDKEKVGKYPGLDEAIEQVFSTAVGTDDVQQVTGDVRTRLAAACGVLSWAFNVNGDE